VIEASVWFSGWMLDAFLGLERLVLTFGVAPARHHAAGELVDDDDLVVLDDVVLVALEQLVCAQRLVDVVNQGNVLDVVEGAPSAGRLLRAVASSFLVAGFGEGRRALLLVDLVVVGLDSFGISVSICCKARSGPRAGRR
jgi:hypothetical protein